MLIHVLSMLGVLRDMFSPFIYGFKWFIYIYIFVIQLIISQHLFKLRSKIKFENHINNDELLKNHMREIKGEGGRGILLN